ncbi:MAG TPA: DUF3108 domain-containing protein [Mesorhizobium sp.]|nr:DUF3108 domain-containing protein [Mesorhizobium sp.]
MPRLPLVLFIAAAGVLPAKAEEFRSAYTVSFMGLPVARSEFATVVEPDRFSIEGKLRASGLAKLFDETEGTVMVTGSVSEAGAVAENYRVDYTNGEKKKRTTISFKVGGVAEAVNEPPLKKRTENWVELTPEHLKSVADPISATLVRAPSLGEVCGRTIRVFDGEMRADLELSPAGQGEWNDRPTVTCRARFVPVAGYRTNRKALDYLAKKSRIEIEFTALGETGLYAPVGASVGTRLGTVTIEAEALDAAGN